MEVQIIGIYVICEEIIKQVGLRDDPQAQMSSAEIMTTHLVAAQWFGNNIQTARRFLRENGCIPNMLSKSRFNRRLHAIPQFVWESCFNFLARIGLEQEKENEFIVDSFPVAVCHNIRIRRSRLYSEEKYRGYTASKKQYFFGLKVHMIATKGGQPVEMVFAPGSEHDLKVFKEMNLNFSEGATIYADAAYNDYEFEDTAKAGGEIDIKAHRKINSKRPISQALNFIIGKNRKKVETVFSSISKLFPKKIHAVTSRGFELKLFTFVLAYSIQNLIGI
jgi:hypothetical protein